MFRRFAISNALALSLSAAVFAQHYTQTNVVSDTPGFSPVTDSQIVNPWGLARGSGSAWWVADNVTGVATLYDGSGAKQSLVVTIPPADATNAKTPTGSPTGTVFNGNPTEFLLAPGKQAVFLFSTVDGTIAAWNPNVGLTPGETAPSTHAVTIVKAAESSAYTGLTSAFVDGKQYLYAANFTKGRVDVYDDAFRVVKLNCGGRNNLNGDPDESDESSFADNRMPAGFVPFNVQAIGNNLVVTYSPADRSVSGPGQGYVDIYSSCGRLLRRLEHGDWLNGPWGVALAPLDFGRFSHELLVAQFAGGNTSPSSGFIAAYDLATGKFDGLLRDKDGYPIAIPGIWAISPGNVAPTNSDPAAQPAAHLYFTAGPDQGPNLFGYLTAVSTDLIKGNAQ